MCLIVFAYAETYRPTYKRSLRVGGRLSCVLWTSCRRRRLSVQYRWSWMRAKLIRIHHAHQRTWVSNVFEYSAVACFPAAKKHRKLESWFAATATFIMNNTGNSKPGKTFLFTSESVGEGHTGKTLFLSYRLEERERNHLYRLLWCARYFENLSFSDYIVRQLLMINLLTA